MQVTVLGKSPAWQDSGGACSGYLIQEAGFTLLLDCGNGVFSRMREVVDYADVDAVLVTHLHADHFFDLVPYSFALSYGVRGDTPRPALLAPPGALEIFTRIGRCRCVRCPITCARTPSRSPPRAPGASRSGPTAAPTRSSCASPPTATCSWSRRRSPSPSPSACAGISPPGRPVSTVPRRGLGGWFSPTSPTSWTLDGAAKAFGTLRGDPSSSPGRGPSSPCDQPCVAGRLTRVAARARWG
jgi:hypothetical protein